MDKQSERCQRYQTKEAAMTWKNINESLVYRFVVRFSPSDVVVHFWVEGDVVVQCWLENDVVVHCWMERRCCR